MKTIYYYFINLLDLLLSIDLLLFNYIINLTQWQII